MTSDSKISKKPLYMNEKVNANSVEKLLAHIIFVLLLVLLSFNMFKVQESFKDRYTYIYIGYDDCFLVE